MIFRNQTFRDNTFLTNAQKSDGFSAGLFFKKVEKPLETCVSSGFTMVAEEGFEPSQTESESVVLPLHNSAVLPLKTNGFKRFFYVVAEEGFEPSQTESESVVLPLHNSARSFCCFVNQRILLYAILRVLSTKTLKIFMKILYKENRNFDDIGSRKSTQQGV